MVTKAVLVFAVLVSAGLAACPKISCGTVTGTNVCATMSSSSSVTVNSSGCGDGYYCSAAAVVSWAMTAANAATTPCLQTSTSGTGTGTWTSHSCGTKVANRTFKSGVTTAIACEYGGAATECELSDGTKAVCMCALTGTGKGICKPDHNNEAIFAKYWEECGTSYTITDQDTAVYWTYYESTWAYQNSQLSCWSIFLEYKLLNDYFDAYDGSLALAMGVFGVAALLA